jgi:hypothetical protein
LSKETPLIEIQDDDDDLPIMTTLTKDYSKHLKEIQKLQKILPASIIQPTSNTLVDSRLTTVRLTHHPSSLGLPFVDFSILAHDDFSRLLDEISSFRKCKPDEIVLVHQGVRIYPWLTPKSLDANSYIFLDVYLLSDYQEMQNALEQKRLALLMDAPKEQQEAEDSSADSADLSDSNINSDNNVIIALRTEKGDVFKLKTTLASSLSQLLKAYVSTHPHVSLDRLKCKFDGEVCDLETTLMDLDVESGDVFDLLIY